MEYNRTYWQAREGTKLNKFTKVNETTSTVELVNSPDAITIAGTEVTTDRLNNMESGIVGAVAGVNEIQGVVDFTTKNKDFERFIDSWNNWYAMTSRLNDVYACVYNGDIYKQSNGTGDFISLGQSLREWHGMCSDDNDVYACALSGDIYKQTGGTGDFISLGLGDKLWTGLSSDGQYIYACDVSGNIYKINKTTGVFDVIKYEPTKAWTGIAIKGGEVYLTVSYGDIYKMALPSGALTPLGQPELEWRGLHVKDNDVYVCGGTDIYKQIGGMGDFIAQNQAAVSWSGITSTGDKLYACERGGDIYTATILTGNTFRASSSFTLPAMPDGARKRILNTHATNAITVTAYAGTTIEGQATMTLSAGHEVELELIGTVWKKTGWNEKALLTYSAPVDCSSRVAEYTGDGGGATIKDRAGNGNNLTATQITYVNGKYGKAIKGNGSSAYAIASSPVIGATGTIAFYGTIPSTDFLFIFDNRNADTNGVNGVALLRANSTTLSFRAWKADASQNLLNIPVTASTKSVIVTFDGTNAIAYVDGVQVATTTLVVIPGTSNLNILRHISGGGYSDSQIDRIRYDSRIWTADEARAWSLNPISIDSRA